MRNKESSLDQNIEACRIAQNRTRVALVTTVISSILVFAALWNSWQGSWSNQRLQLTRDAITLKIWNVQLRDSLTTSTQKDEFDKARSFAILRGIADSSRLVEVHQEMQNILIEEISNIRIPIIGIIFDINDLGIASGLSFIALVLWLRFCLMRQLQNLRLTIKEAASQNQLPYCSGILSMHQLFTITETEEGISQIWKKIPTYLIWLPLLVITLVFGHDIYSYNYGVSISFLNTMIVYVISLIAVIAVSYLTISCYSLLRKIDKVWLSSIMPNTK